MTGPLAQQFAQVRDTLRNHHDSGCFVYLSSGACDCGVEPNTASLAALSAIERHVQDMARWEEIAKDWRYSNEFLGQVVRQKWPAEFPRAALPAREKEEETK